MAVRRIITHEGGAHKDDLLACSVLVAVHRAPVVRRDPTPEELEDPEVLVVDVGGSHDPPKGNFDHHQFPRDHPPICALSLVLDALDLYEDARLCCDWLEVAEWLDSRGPVATARHLQIERGVIGQLNSPVDVTLLRRFARARQLRRGDLVWEMMRLIGDDLLSYVRNLRRRLEEIGETAEFWAMEHPAGALEVLYLPRREEEVDDPGLGLARFVEARGREDRVAALVYPDRRGSGYGLSRYNDDGRVDFTRIEGEHDVHFAHVRGFVAKTTARDPRRLRELLARAFVA